MQLNLTKSSILGQIPGVSHGFLTNHNSKDREVLENAEPSIATVKQVHGDQLFWASALEKRQREADGLATLKPGLAVGVYSADCTPILMVATDASERAIAVMAVHAGWRGTAAGIAEKAFAEFSRVTLPAGAAAFHAVIGPCISFESFEVGPEVVAAFPGSLDRGIAKFLRVEGEKKKYLFNLPGENARQLEDYATRSDLALQLETLPLCTLKLNKYFPSYRRDREKAGRILSYVAFDLN